MVCRSLATAALLILIGAVGTPAVAQQVTAVQAATSTPPPSLAEMRLNTEFQKLNAMKDRLAGIAAAIEDLTAIADRAKGIPKPSIDKAVKTIESVATKIDQDTSAAGKNIVDYVWGVVGEDDSLPGDDLPTSILEYYMEPFRDLISSKRADARAALDPSTATYRESVLRSLLSEVDSVEIKEISLPTSPASSQSLKALIEEVSKSEVFDRLKQDVIQAIQSVTAAQQVRQKDIEKAIADLEKTVNELAVAASQGQVGLDQKQLEINQIFAYTITPAFVFVVAIVFLIFRVLPQVTQNEMVRHGILVEVITVFLLVPTVLILGVASVLKSDTIGALLGGIAGYVLGRSLQQSKPQAVELAARPPNESSTQPPENGQARPQLSSG